MKVCSLCNKEFDDERDYCDFCGIKLDVVESEAQEYAEELDEKESLHESDALEEMPEEEEPESEAVDEEGNSCPVCGTVNPDAAKFCMSCAANLSVPFEEMPGKNLKLILPGGKELEFTGDKMTIGREDFMGLLSDEKLRFISRKNNPEKPDSCHFTIISDGKEFYVIDENSGNNTVLRDENIRGQGQKLLHDGDEIIPAGEVYVGVKIE